MKIKWRGVLGVAVAALAIVMFKHFDGTPTVTPSGTPSVLLVANLAEANDPADRCSEIIAAVRAARRRGVRVAELMPDSSSPLLKKYHVVSAPTVVIIGKNGRALARFVGESVNTVLAIKTKLATLRSG